MRKTMKPEHDYFVINIDEPYAKAIYEVLKAGQIAKGEWTEGDITFEEWKILTFQKICRTCSKSKYIDHPYHGKELHCLPCREKHEPSVVDEDDTCKVWKAKEEAE